MAGNLDPDYSSRNEWKTIEGQRTEKLFSELNVPGFDGDGFAYVETLTDSAMIGRPGSPSTFYDVFSRLDASKDQLRNTILRIAAKKDCLKTSKRFEVLCRHINGETKREITKALYPHKIDIINKSEKTIGVEVYVQNLINFYIPYAIRRYVEAHYPHFVFKYLGFFPMHPKFILQAWMDALRSGEPDAFSHFMSLFDGNPAALVELRQIVVDMAPSIRIVGGRRFPGFNLLSQTAGLIIRLLERRIITVKGATNMISEFSSPEARGALALVIKLALARHRTVNS